MSRRSKLSEVPSPLESAERLLEIIIDDIIEAAALSFEDWIALGSSPLVPLTIPVGPGRQYAATQTGVDAAHRLCSQVWKARPDLNQTISRKTFDRIVFTAIGAAVAASKGHLPDDELPESVPNEAFYAAVASDFAANLELLAIQSRGDLDRHIPCTLFDVDQDVPGFQIGPVAFLPRRDWLDRYVTNSLQRAHIQRVEDRTESLDAMRQRALAGDANDAAFQGWEILTALRNFSWVASVRVSGHEPDQSHRKASIVVGLAMDALGLRFHADAARRFTRMGRQHLFSEDRLATRPDGGFLRGSSMRVAGIGSRPGVLTEKVAAEKPFLDAAGEILAVYLSGRQFGRAPHLIERWVNALYWTGEARREASDFMAVVDYGCAADVLSGAGGDAKLMTAFAEAALNPSASSTPAGTISVADAVSRVYREGRNKLAHGEASGVLEDLSEIREIGDQLVVHLFDAVTLELGEVIRTRPQILELPEDHAYRALKARLAQRRQFGGDGRPVSAP